MAMGKEKGSVRFGMLLSIGLLAIFIALRNYGLSQVFDGVLRVVDIFVLVSLIFCSGFFAVVIINTKIYYIAKRLYVLNQVAIQEEEISDLRDLIALKTEMASKLLGDLPASSLFSLSLANQIISSVESRLETVTYLIKKGGDIRINKAYELINSEIDLSKDLHNSLITNSFMPSIKNELIKETIFGLLKAVKIENLDSSNKKVAA